MLKGFRAAGERTAGRCTDGRLPRAKCSGLGGAGRSRERNQKRWVIGQVSLSLRAGRDDGWEFQRQRSRPCAWGQVNEAGRGV